jgi:hypothetical protein
MLDRKGRTSPPEPAPPPLELVPSNDASGEFAEMDKALMADGECEAAE